MNKKLFNIIALGAAVCFGFTACDEDNDDNPTLDLSHVDEGFVLNTPANAANNTYDLVNSTSLELTCSQPNYGTWNDEIIPYAVRYYVQTSLESTGFDNDSYIELSTSYTSCDMFVDASEVNSAVVDLWTAANPDQEYVSEVRPLYVRLRAVLDNTDGMGETYSNSITLPNVLATYKAPDATYPDALYVCGNSIQSSWSSWKELAPVYGVSGEYYTMIYSDANSGFKWGTYAQQWLGYSDVNTLTDSANAGLSEDGDGNIVIANAGWYTLHFVVTLSGSLTNYELIVETAQAGVIGNAWDGASWTEGNAMMTAPADASGVWESPAADASGELRAYIKVGSYDWWRTEFTLYGGDLYWRTVDIADNWETNVGADYSVTVSAGQKLYVDFNYNTGYVE